MRPTRAFCTLIITAAFFCPALGAACGYAEPPPGYRAPSHFEEVQGAFDIVVAVPKRCIGKCNVEKVNEQGFTTQTNIEFGIIESLKNKKSVGSVFLIPGRATKEKPRSGILTDDIKSWGPGDCSIVYEFIPKRKYIFFISNEQESQSFTPHDLLKEHDTFYIDFLRKLANISDKKDNKIQNESLQNLMDHYAEMNTEKSREAAERIKYHLSNPKFVDIAKQSPTGSNGTQP